MLDEGLVVQQVVRDSGEDRQDDDQGRKQQQQEAAHGCTDYSPDGGSGERRPEGWIRWSYNFV